MTVEFDRMLLQHIIELLRPLLDLGDDEGLTYLLKVVEWDGQALGITDAITFAPAVNSLNDAIQGLSELLEQDSISLEDLTGVLTPLATAVIKIIDLISSLPHPKEIPDDAFKRFRRGFAEFHHRILSGFFITADCLYS